VIGHRSDAVHQDVVAPCPRPFKVMALFMATKYLPKLQFPQKKKGAGDDYRLHRRRELTAVEHRTGAACAEIEPALLGATNREIAKIHFVHFKH